MRKLIFGLFIAVLPALGLAAGSTVPLDSFESDHSDKASLQRGAATFTNYCMGCHSMEYARYKRVAEDLEIPDELYEENLIFTGDRDKDQAMFLAKLGYVGDDGGQCGNGA